MNTVSICTGGTVEWVTLHRKCDRCWHYTTQYGRCQLWYDTDWTCGRCGIENFRPGPPAKDRARATATRREFTDWLLMGSPRLNYEDA